MNPISQDFLQRLTRARVQAGLSMGQSAMLLGVSAATLSRYETGARRVPRARLEKLAQVYDVSYDWLIDGKLSLSDEEIARWRDLMASFSPEVIDRTLGLLGSMSALKEKGGGGLKS